MVLKIFFMKIEASKSQAVGANISDLPLFLLLNRQMAGITSFLKHIYKSLFEVIFKSFGSHLVLLRQQLDGIVSCYSSNCARKVQQAHFMLIDTDMCFYHCGPASSDFLALGINIELPFHLSLD